MDLGNYKLPEVNDEDAHKTASKWIVEIADKLNIPKGRVFGQTKEWSMTDLMAVHDNTDLYWDTCNKYNKQ